MKCLLIIFRWCVTVQSYIQRGHHSPCVTSHLFNKNTFLLIHVNRLSDCLFKGFPTYSFANNLSYRIINYIINICFFFKRSKCFPYNILDFTVALNSAIICFFMQTTACAVTFCNKFAVSGSNIFASLLRHIIRSIMNNDQAFLQIKNIFCERWPRFSKLRLLSPAIIIKLFIMIEWCHLFILFLPDTCNCNGINTMMTMVITRFLLIFTL